MYTLANALFALISVAAAAYVWISSYDDSMRLDTLERKVDSLQGQVSRTKQEALQKVDEALQHVEERVQANQGGSGSGGMESMMEKMLPAMMAQSMGGQAMGGDGAEPANQQQDKAPARHILGNGGTQRDGTDSER